jgi:two-component system response regulator WspF
MRIAIVNDMMMAVEAMRRVIIAHGGHQVVWVARDGEAAVQQCQRDRPDLILMDLVMPHLDGIEATRRIMAKTPCAIVIVTASVRDYTAKVFEAMGAGALDAVNTPVLSGATGADGAKSLLAKIETIHRLIAPSPWPSSPPRAASGARRPGAQKESLVCIGTSAGGPAALARVLAGLPAGFPAAVVIVQHVDAQFAQGLADWLASHAQLPVRLAEEGELLQPGVVLLAGRNHHLVLARPRHLGYSRAAANCAYRPSVDVFFKSVAQHCPGPAVGVLLTGMGRDGAAGLLAMRQRGFLTLAQDAASSAVFGMPKAAADLQAAAEILALGTIAPRLIAEMQNDKCRM